MSIKKFNLARPGRILSINNFSFRVIIQKYTYLFNKLYKFVLIREVLREMSIHRIKL